MHGARVTAVMETDILPILVFMDPFAFELLLRTGQTNEQTGGQDSQCGLLRRSQKK